MATKSPSRAATRPRSPYHEFQPPDKAQADVGPVATSPLVEYSLPLTLVLELRPPSLVARSVAPFAYPVERPSHGLRSKKSRCAPNMSPA